MNSKSLLSVVFAACVLLAYGPIASAETAKRTEPADATETNESGEAAESWTSGAAAPDEDTSAERSAEEEVVDNLDPVDPNETRPSPGQAGQKNAPRTASDTRTASDQCLVSTIEAVLEADRAGRGSELSIDAKDGVVSLTGPLTDKASIEHVQNLVAGVKGVNRVDTKGLTAGKGPGSR